MRPGEPERMSWMERLVALVRRLGGRDPDRTDYVTANAEMVLRAIRGFGPEVAPIGGVAEQSEDISRSADSQSAVTAAADAGARVVVNIPNVHVPAFCAASASGGDSRPYKNVYDLVRAHRELPMTVGETPPPTISKRRNTVDSALPLPPGHSFEDVYFGAMELNGTGVRFFGDFCLVLSPGTVGDETPLLDRNSYDLMRSPLYDRILGGKRPSVSVRLSGAVDAFKEPTAAQKAAIANEARAISGSWGADRGEVAAIKVLDARGAGMRRISTGQISDGVLDDEDYIEVLKHGSFRVAHLQEVRVAAADVAADARIADRSRFGPPPSGAAELWRDRRHAAEQALARGAPALRIVTSRGRMK